MGTLEKRKHQNGLCNKHACKGCLAGHIVMIYALQMSHVGTKQLHMVRIRLHMLGTFVHVESLSAGCLQHAPGRQLILVLG